MLLGSNAFVNATVSHAAHWSKTSREHTGLGNTCGGGAVVHFLNWGLSSNRNGGGLLNGGNNLFGINALDNDLINADVGFTESRVFCRVLLKYIFSNSMT